MKKIVLIMMLLNLSLFAGQINIAVAANVSYAMEDLIKEFHSTNPKTKVLVTLGSSGKLTAQIKNGAPYHLFMSANMKYPNALYQEKIAITKPIVYAQGGLVIFSAKPIDFSQGIVLTTNESLKRIAIANPKTAPYGKAALEAFKSANIYDKIVKKLVYAESISQTVSYAVTATDIGLIAKSSLYSPKMSTYKNGLHYKEVDSKLYTPINQGVVILKNAKNNQEVKNFYAFILSRKAQDIFKKFGYLIP